MFVGEAPGYHEDKQGRPFVGAAGKLLDELLASINLRRDQVYIANVLKSRPPNNRDPQADEIEACTPYLVTQIEIIRPRVICSLGNFATKFLSGSPMGISHAHGHPQRRQIGDHVYTLYPMYHPAAALYTPSMLDTLRADFQRLPRLLEHSQADAAPLPGRREEQDCAPATSRGESQTPLPDVEHDSRRDSAAGGAFEQLVPDGQLGLF